MKLFSNTKLLSCALSLFALTATVYGGASSSSQEDTGITPPKYCGFRSLSSNGSGPLQIIMDYLDDGRNFVLALYNLKSLSPKPKNEKNQASQLYEITTYLNADTPLKISLILENQTDFLRIQQILTTSGVQSLVSKYTSPNDVLAPMLDILNNQGVFRYLRYLNLSGNDLSIHNTHVLGVPIPTPIANGFLPFIQSLAQLTKLEHLDISDCSIHIDEAQALAPCLAQFTYLKYFDLSSNYIDDDGAQALAPSLALITNLTYFDLSGNELFYDDPDTRGIGALLQNLVLFTKLEYLKLSVNEIGPDEVQDLALSLDQLTNLRHLDLSENDIGPNEARDLAPSLGLLSKLEHLDLHSSSVTENIVIGPDGARALAPSLGLLIYLKELYLGGNDIGSDGALALTPSLALLIKLKKLDMSENEISETGKQALKQSLAHIPGLDLIL